MYECSLVFSVRAAYRRFGVCSELPRFADVFGFALPGGCSNAATACSDIPGFAPSGDSLFFEIGLPPSAKKSKQKKAHPAIRVSLRSTSLTPAPLRGRLARAAIGISRHPCRSPLCTTIALTLLKGEIRAPERTGVPGVARSVLVVVKSRWAVELNQWFHSRSFMRLDSLPAFSRHLGQALGLTNVQARRASGNNLSFRRVQSPPRRANGIVVEFGDFCPQKLLVSCSTPAPDRQ